MSQQPFAIYDDTGAILQVGHYDEATWNLILSTDNPYPGQHLIALEAMADLTFAQRNYVTGGVVTPKQEMSAAADKTTIAADGVEVATITGLPIPCNVTVAGLISGQVTVLDGTLELTFDHPGDFQVTATSDPIYLPWSVTIRAS
jgi:hypothetical protein